MRLNFLHKCNFHFRRCWSSEKSVMHNETPMINRADFSVSNNNQKLQIASPSPRQAQCKLRLRETLGQGSESPPELADEINFVQCGRHRADNDICNLHFENISCGVGTSLPAAGSRPDTNYMYASGQNS